LAVHVLIIVGVSIRGLLRPHRDPAARIAWILFITALPYAGALLYLMLGEVRPVGVPTRQRLPSSAQQGSLRLIQNTVSVPEIARPGFMIGQSISGFEPVGGNTGRLLEDSNSVINAIVADIDAATNHVHLLFYIWLSD